MASTSADVTSTATTDAGASREKRRLIILKIFLVAAIFNNGFIAWYCLGKGGGETFASAPEWSASVVGMMGLLTIVGAIAALAWKKVGVVAILGAGTVAAGTAAVVQLFAAAATFAVGTAFMALLAYHLWHRFD